MDILEIYQYQAEEIVYERKSQHCRSQNFSSIYPLYNSVNPLAAAAAMLDCGKAVDSHLFKQLRWLGTFIARSATHIFGYEIICNVEFAHRSFSIESDYADS